MPIRKTYRYDNGSHVVEGFRVGRFNLGINTTFIVYRIGDTLIDAGPTNQWRSVKAGLKDCDIRQLLITHHHEDHCGNAHNIADHFNLLPYAPALGQEKIRTGYKTPAMQRIIWGSPKPATTQTLTDNLTLSDGSPIIPVHTPGHAKDLTCIFLPAQKYLFSGDMYISKSMKYMRSDENLQLLIDGLRKLLALDFDILFCPHNGIVEQGREALQGKLDNLLKLCQQAQTLRQKNLPLEQITEQLLGPEDMLAKISKGNFCKANLISEALKVELS